MVGTDPCLYFCQGSKWGNRDNQFLLDWPFYGMWPYLLQIFVTSCRSTPEGIFDLIDLIFIIYYYFGDLTSKSGQGWPVFKTFCIFFTKAVNIRRRSVQDTWSSWSKQSALQKKTCYNQIFARSSSKHLKAANEFQEFSQLQQQHYSEMEKKHDFKCQWWRLSIGQMNE